MNTPKNIDKYNNLIKVLLVALKVDKEKLEFPIEILNLLILKQEETVLPSSTNSSFIIYGRIPVELSIQFEEFKDKLMDIIYDNYDEDDIEDVLDKIFDVRIGLTRNMKFMKKVLVSDFNQNTVLSHNKGETLIIDFWASWCTFCQEPMQKLVDYIKTNSEFIVDNKIRIAAISADEKYENWKNHIITKKWNIKNLEHYNYKNIREIMGIKMIPAVCIVNKEGDVVYFGHPRNLKLNEDVKNALSGKSISSITTTNKSDFFVLSDEKKKEILSKVNEFIKEKNNLNKVNATIISKSEFSIGNCEYNSCLSKLTLFGEIQEFEKEECDKLEKDLLLLSKTSIVEQDFIIQKFIIDEDF